MYNVIRFHIVMLHKGQDIEFINTITQDRLKFDSKYS
jgi:hypothetical protein